jgi:hypothetical protein
LAINDWIFCAAPSEIWIMSRVGLLVSR